MRFPPARLLVAVDLSGPSVAAWRHAEEWAAKFGSALKAVHAQAPAPPGPPVASRLKPGAVRRSLVEEFRKRTGGRGMTVVEGDPVPVILGLARAWKPDLIVMGTHGRSGVERLLLGSVAEGVMRESPAPVLIVHDEPQPVRSVLAPVNFTPYSDDAFVFAASVAARFGAQLTVQHLLEAGESWARARLYLGALTAKLPQEVREACVPRTVVSRGPAVEAIARTAEGHDLVVLAAHRKGVLRDAVLGTTAEQVLRAARTALLAVPARAA